MTKPTWDEYFLSIVEAVSQRATCNRGKCGAVLTRENRILLTGYVGAPSGMNECDEVGHLFHEVTDEKGNRTTHCVRTLHAEQNIICTAARFGVVCEGSTIYIKMTPCYTCSKMIIAAGIKRVVCQNLYKIDNTQMLLDSGISVDIINDKVMQYSKST